MYVYSFIKKSFQSYFRTFARYANPPGYHMQNKKYTHTHYHVCLPAARPSSSGYNVPWVKRRRLETAANHSNWSIQYMVTISHSDFSKYRVHFTWKFQQHSPPPLPSLVLIDTAKRERLSVTCCLPVTTISRNILRYIFLPQFKITVCI